MYMRGNVCAELKLIHVHVHVYGIPASVPQYAFSVAHGPSLLLPSLSPLSLSLPSLSPLSLSLPLSPLSLPPSLPSLSPSLSPLSLSPEICLRAPKGAQPSPQGHRRVPPQPEGN